MNPPTIALEETCLNVLRGLAMDAVQRANSGHPGMPMGAAAMAHALWTRHLKHDPAQPLWFDRDRFVLSAGHGSMLLYALLHLTGYDLSLEDIKNFRQWGSRTPGHPEIHLTPGVEMATGPLGQGFATAVGMAMAESYLAAHFNASGEEVVDHFTWVLCSDGDLMEGVSNEAASLAGHQGLGKLIALYDSNAITIDGSTDLSFSEDVASRFQALGWGTWECDGMEVDAVDQCLSEARQDDGRPSLIVCRTTIGFGSPNKAGSAKSHGAALGPDEVAATKAALGMPAEEFWIDPEALAFYRRALEQGRQARERWEGRVEALRQGRPELAAEFEAYLEGRPDPSWLEKVPAFEAATATRDASHTVINAFAPVLKNWVGGCADLAESVKTTIKGGGDASAHEPGGRNVPYGVREHAMAAAVNGLNLHGGVRAFGGTFLIFSDYCRPSLRLAALMETPSVFCFSHDSIGLGEDGPTHQPVEQIMSLRLIPNLNLMRPADANETVACWKIAIESKQTPCLLVLSRQKLPLVTPALPKNHPAARGAYVLREASGGSARLVIVATGSEVALAVEACDELEKAGVPTRVVSMPSWFLFEKQDAEYRGGVLPRGVPTLSIEAGATLGWERYAQASVGLDHFGASAPGERLFEEFGFTVENVVSTARRLLG
ncbi:MAG: transketolase [Fimbriimonadaceae bacterium]|nr:transketolase [Fimbriimonadaceae bacterium]QYK55378.1 MAG: transketolase [Fimbriimonadaceae bacterium]